MGTMMIPAAGGTGQRETRPGPVVKMSLVERRPGLGWEDNTIRETSAVQAFSLESHHLCEKPGMAVAACNPSTGEKEQEVVYWSCYHLAPGSVKELDSKK